MAKTPTSEAETLEPSTLEGPDVEATMGDLQPTGDLADPEPEPEAVPEPEPVPATEAPTESYVLTHPYAYYDDEQEGSPLKAWSAGVVVSDPAEIDDLLLREAPMVKAPHEEVS